MYTATIHQHDGDTGVTKNLRAKTHRSAKSEAFDHLPSHDGASVAVERDGLYVGKWHRVASRVSWTTED